MPQSFQNRANTDRVGEIPVDMPSNPAGAVSPATSDKALLVNPESAVHKPEPIRVAGKFLYRANEKLFLRGTTYGTFRPDEQGDQYPSPEQVEADFKLMSASAINAVRTYTIPPAWLLDAAERHGLLVLIGLAWEQHIAFLEEESRVHAIRHSVADQVRSFGSHPAVLGITLGNEIPSSIVRWHGRKAVERFLKSLYDEVKGVNPDCLVTYVNYPTTEYLSLPFLDFVAFNVYLEAQEDLEAYLARLHNLAGDRPMIMAEIGLDSRRNGELGQADSLTWQIQSAFDSGCAGTFVYAWTDEWYRGGHDIEDWDFGLTTRDRRPKPALEAVKSIYRHLPFGDTFHRPRISTVVCTYNGSRTICQTIEGLLDLDYPDYEIIVVDDGSTDATAAIVSEHPSVRLIQTENRGLSAARNTGYESSTGEIIAYIDDDAFPDPNWLTYLAHVFVTTDCCGVGGPNLLPPGDGPLAECVYNSPGGPAHVLLSDRVAEHIPGCNMAFRKSHLEAIGGFDPIFRTAGDDVDLCWRMQDQGWQIRFHPAAVVWHHRRNSLRNYWKQQIGYGRAEALLEKKWPQRYNAVGHIPWAGRIYGSGQTLPVPWRRSRVYQGAAGVAPFQMLYGPKSGTLSQLPLMPEWYLVIGILGSLSVAGIRFSPLLILSLPLLVLAVAAPVVQAIVAAANASFTSGITPASRKKLRVVVGLLHLLQPAARLYGRLKHGLTMWRRRGTKRAAIPRTRHIAVWSEQWCDPGCWLALLEAEFQKLSVAWTRGGDYDEWDVQVRGGIFSVVRLRMAIEEHGGGKQYARFRVRPRYSWFSVLVLAFLAILAVGLTIFGATAGLEPGSWMATGVVGILLLVLSLQLVFGGAQAEGAMLDAIRALGEDVEAGRWVDLDSSDGSSSEDKSDR